MISFGTSGKSSLFERSDPRIRILWMFVLSATVIVQTSLVAIAILFLSMIPVWAAAKRTVYMLRATIKLTKFLAFLFVIQLIVAWVSHQEFLTQKAMLIASVEVSRFSVMLASAILIFQTTDFGEIQNSIRTLKTKRIPVAKTLVAWNKTIEAFAFIIGTAYQMVPILKREMEVMAQVQRSRGMGVTEGGRIEQVKKLVRLGPPLFVRSLELSKNSALALLNYGYSPLRKRTQYRYLKFSRWDWLAMATLIAGAAIFLIVF